MRLKINTGKWTIEELDRILHESSAIKDAGTRIEIISRIFLDVGYAGSTLIGDVTTPEAFAVNLEKVDCFTFIDYVEAMRCSDSFSGFMENLKMVRYHSEGMPSEDTASNPPSPPFSKGGNIEVPPLIKGDKRGFSFKNRNHFFTDWVKYNAGLVADVTDIIGEHSAIQVMKKLNLKKDGTYFIQGIKPEQREITYIPAGEVDDDVIKRLKTGDYSGIYSDEEGLDVSHVGIIIRKGDMIYLRHASSRANIRKVIDEDFLYYMKEKPGLIVLRPK